MVTALGWGSRFLAPLEVGGISPFPTHARARQCRAGRGGGARRSAALLAAPSGFRCSRLAERFCGCRGGRWLRPALATVAGSEPAEVIAARKRSPSFWIGPSRLGTIWVLDEQQLRAGVAEICGAGRSARSRSSLPRAGLRLLIRWRFCIGCLRLDRPGGARDSAARQRTLRDASGGHDLLGSRPEIFARWRVFGRLLVAGGGRGVRRRPDCGCARRGGVLVDKAWFTRRDRGGRRGSPCWTRCASSP